jgi:hypothetical protein
MGRFAKERGPNETLDGIKRIIGLEKAIGQNKDGGMERFLVEVEQKCRIFANLCLEIEPKSTYVAQ